jgi:hypothetical protein
MEELVITGMRLRLNISTTSKGFKSWEHTVEVSTDGEPTGDERTKVALFSEQQEAYLESKYGKFQDTPKEK